MRILQINSVCGIGSTGRIATDIHHILIEEGHESYIAYGRGFPVNCESTFRIGTKYDNYAHVALTRIYDKHGFGSTKATEKFIKKIDELEPDIIHLHNIHGYYINIEMLFGYLKKSDKTFIWTLHDCWAITGHCSNFDNIGCNKWRTGCSDCRYKSSYPTSLLFDNSQENYIRKKNIFTKVNNLMIVTPSQWLADIAKNSFLREYPIKVINNGINLNIFKPTKSLFRKNFLLEDKFIILGVANVWNTAKGFEYFLELSKHLDKNKVIVMVGLTKKQLIHLPKNIIGIQNTSNIQELAEIYSTSDVFVNPTLEEVLGLTNLEALGCGTPVITFNTGGSPETIDDTCGIVTKEQSIDALIETIEIIYKQGKDYYTQNCIKRAKQLYSKKDMIHEYISTYTSNLNSISK